MTISFSDYYAADAARMAEQLRQLHQYASSEAERNRTEKEEASFVKQLDIHVDIDHVLTNEGRWYISSRPSQSIVWTTRLDGMYMSMYMRFSSTGELTFAQPLDLDCNSAWKDIEFYPAGDKLNDGFTIRITPEVSKPMNKPSKSKEKFIKNFENNLKKELGDDYTRYTNDGYTRYTI